MASFERINDRAISPLIDDLPGHLDETLVRIPPADFATLMSGLLTATTAAAFLTSASAPARGEGAITVTAEGIPLEEVSATASEISASNLGGYHRINSKGVKYRVLAGAQGWDVRGFGGRLDGITDDSVAVRRAVWAAIGAKAATAVGGNDVVPSAIYFAGGECRITQPRALLDETGAGRGFGLSYVGATPGTTINFDHDGEDYLCYNANEFLTVTFRNLRFTADSDNVRFMYSNGAGGAQDVMYERCTWDGVWQKLYRLEGANNNSEWRWSNCNITCSVRDVALDIPADGSDQFLHYWGTGCEIWLYDGTFIRARKGGHFHFVNCDWSGLNPRADSNPSNPRHGYLFEDLGNDHARGVCSLTITGGRLEHERSCPACCIASGITARSTSPLSTPARRCRRATPSTGSRT